MTVAAPKLFQIKICGVTRPQDVASVIAAGGDAVGLNFFPDSSRFVGPQAAAAVSEACGTAVQRVGVFVNASPQEILHLAAVCQLDWLQLHGDEPPEMLADLEAYPILRAFRFGAEGFRPLQQYLERCVALQALPAAILLDAAAAGHFGGSGQTLDWPRLRTELDGQLELPWILAGGLGPHNVSDAIRQARPRGVDTASGVESSPGIKDPGLVSEFVTVARETFAEIAKKQS